MQSVLHLHNHFTSRKPTNLLLHLHGANAMCVA
jgi:hypothetical protein